MISSNQTSVQVVSHKFDGTTNKVEEWFGVDYVDVPIDTTFLKTLREQGVNSALHLPEPNMYITIDFSIKSQEKESVNNLHWWVVNDPEISWNHLHKSC